MSAPAPLPITLEHVLLQIGVVEKQDVIVVDNKREPEAEQSASIAKIDENGEPNSNGILYYANDWLHSCGTPDVYDCLVS